MKIQPKNWSEFQHYRDRKPPWIRLHRTLIDNREFNALPPMACKVLLLLWLLASEEIDGVVDDDPAELAFRMRLPPDEVAEAMACIKAFGFVVAAEGQDPSPRDQTVAQQLREQNGFGSRYISDKVRREVWQRDSGKCQDCSSEENVEYDHIHPVSKGGTSEAGNVQLLCRPCNRKKRTKTAEQVATPAQPELVRRTTETETETETEREKTLSGKPDASLPSKPNPKTQARAAAREILAFLNDKTGRNYQPVDANLEFIVARLREGATTVQCRQVIAKKTREWAGDEKMTEYLRPATLFNRTKFAQYVGELVVNP